MEAGTHAVTATPERIAEMDRLGNEIAELSAQTSPRCPASAGDSGRSCSGAPSKE